ncbi:cysteine synthase A [Candidatus Poribacteria bacterium]|nr:cysteine synthase A [Candidatus Poribacteria bacterium]
MPNIYENITKTIGKTPLVRLNNITEGINAKVLAKLEYFNPLRCIKERITINMIEDAEKRGLVNKDTVIIEPTSGNTGIGLACVCASKGYRLILTMSEKMSEERRKLMEFLGAELVLTPASEGTQGAIKKARELVKSTPNSFMPDQFNNPANPHAHRKTTGEEIWQDTQGKVDFLVSSVGTGGTITGVSELIKERKPSFKAIAVEPWDSPVLSGGKPGSHNFQGMGAGFIPGVLNTNIIDEIIKVKAKNAFDVAKQMAVKEGILCGMSSGAAVWASLEVAKRIENIGKTIVVIIPDTGERYLSTELFMT